MDWKDQRVWITGASSGIGAALAERVAAAGAQVILSARNENALRDVQSRCQDPRRHRVVPVDLEKPETLAGIARSVWNEAGRVDVLINNAGISQRGLVRDTSLDVDRRIMEVNFFAVVALTKAVLPLMIESGGGHIVTVSSLTGKLSTPLRSAYAASKHALHGFMDALRAETHDQGIRVTVACPGFVRTNISRSSLTGDGGTYGILDRAVANGMSPEHCANRIVRAVEQGRDEVVIAGKERLALLLRQTAPSLYNRLIRKIRVH